MGLNRRERRIVASAIVAIGIAVGVAGAVVAMQAVPPSPPSPEAVAASDRASGSSSVPATDVATTAPGETTATSAPAPVAAEAASRPRKRGATTTTKAPAKATSPAPATTAPAVPAGGRIASFTITPPDNNCLGTTVATAAWTSSASTVDLSAPGLELPGLAGSGTSLVPYACDSDDVVGTQIYVLRARSAAGAVVDSKEVALPHFITSFAGPPSVGCSGDTTAPLTWTTRSDVVSVDIFVDGSFVGSFPPNGSTQAEYPCSEDVVEGHTYTLRANNAADLGVSAELTIPRG